MTKAVYDPNLDGVIALAETEAKIGDMEKSVYDADDDGKFPNDLQEIGYNPVTSAILFTKKVSDVLRHSHDAEVVKNTDNTTYSIEKTITFTNGVKGVLRIKYDLGRVACGTAYGRLYKNGVAIGTEQSRAADYLTFSEDIDVGTIEIGEILELKLKNSLDCDTKARNLRIYYDNDDTAASVAVASANS